MEFIYILSNSWLLEYVTLFFKSQFNSVELSVLSCCGPRGGCQLPCCHAIPITYFQTTNLSPPHCFPALTTEWQHQLRHATENGTQHFRRTSSTKRGFLSCEKPLSTSVLASNLSFTAFVCPEISSHVNIFHATTNKNRMIALGPEGPSQPCNKLI